MNGHTNATLERVMDLVGAIIKTLIAAAGAFLLFGLVVMFLMFGHQ